MYIIFGIITSFLTVLLEMIFLKGSFSLHSFQPGIIIPAGGWIDGILCSSGIYIYLKIRHKRVKLKHRLFSVIIAFVTFWMIYLASYYFYFSRELHTFNDYLNFVFRNTTVTSTSNGIVSSVDNLGIGFNELLFIIELFGFCLGGLTAGVIAIEGRDYCKRCKIDFMRKNLFSFSAEHIDEEINEFENAISSKKAFDQFIMRDRKIEDNSSFYYVSIKYCFTCKTAFIEFKYMYHEKNKENMIITKEDRDKYKVFKLPYEFC